jgi:hypothetical protein
VLDYILLYSFNIFGSILIATVIKTKTIRFRQDTVQTTETLLASRTGFACGTLGIWRLKERS